jgi:hypothetical protein
MLIARHGMSEKLPPLLRLLALKRIMLSEAAEGLSLWDMACDAGGPLVSRTIQSAPEFERSHYRIFQLTVGVSEVEAPGVQGRFHKLGGQQSCAEEARCAGGDVQNR